MTDLHTAARQALDLLTTITHWDHRGDTLCDAWDESLANNGIKWDDVLETLRAALGA